MILGVNPCPQKTDMIVLIMRMNLSVVSNEWIWSSFIFELNGLKLGPAMMAHFIMWSYSESVCIQCQKMNLMPKGFLIGNMLTGWNFLNHCSF